MSSQFNHYRRTIRNELAKLQDARVQQTEMAALQAAGLFRSGQLGFLQGHGAPSPFEQFLGENGKGQGDVIKINRAKTPTIEEEARRLRDYHAPRGSVAYSAWWYVADYKNKHIATEAQPFINWYNENYGTKPKKEDNKPMSATTQDPYAVMREEFNREYERANKTTKGATGPKESKLDHFTNYFKRNSDILMTIIMVILADHFLLGGKLRAKIEQTLGGLLDGCANKGVAAGGPVGPPPAGPRAA